MSKKLSVALLSVLCGLTGLASASATISWFINKATVDSAAQPIVGDTEGAYFAYGNGKLYDPNGDDKPYGIKTPRHLYNLAWLTYLGYFNDKPQMYFELADNIDMTGWTLPPIGTEQYPFVGSFDGQGYVISNLNTSNDYTDFGNKHPSKVTKDYFTMNDNSNNNYPNVVGFFGVVGNLNNRYAGGTYYPNINVVKNFGLKSATIEAVPLTNAQNNAVSTEALVGIVAGYVVGNAKMSDVAVDSSGLNLGTNLVAFDSNKTNALSDHTIIGYTTNKKTINKLNQNIYGVNIQNLSEFSTSGQGDGVGFGGSINMKNLYQRIQSVKNKGSSYNSTSSFKYRVGRKRSPEGVYSDDTSKDKTTSNLFTYVSGSENGTYSMLSSSSQYNYMMGGYNQVTSFQEYYVQTKITNGTDFMTSSITGGEISNTTVPGSAIFWVVPKESSTKYVFAVSNDTKYYLTADSNLNLSLTTVNGNNNPSTSWKRDDSNGMMRLTTTINGVDYYLDCINHVWQLSEYPTNNSSVTTAPTAPTEPYYQEHLPYDETHHDTTDYHGNEQIANSKQIYYRTSNVYVDNIFANNKFSTNEKCTPGWLFSGNLANNSTTKISSIVNSNTYYVGVKCITTATTESGCTGSSTSYSYNYEMVFDTRNSIDSSTSKPDDDTTVTTSYIFDWTVAVSGDNKTFSVKHTNNNTTNTRYLHYNNGEIDLNESNSNSQFEIIDVYAANQAIYDYNHTGPNSIDAQNQAIDTANGLKESAYNTALSEYQTSYQTWVNSLSGNEGLYNEYLENLAATFTLDIGIDEAGYGHDDEAMRATYDDYSNKDADIMVYNSNNTTYMPLNVETDGTSTDLSNYSPTNNNTGYIICGSQLTNGVTFSKDVSDTRVSYNSRPQTSYNGTNYTCILESSFNSTSKKIVDVKTIDSSGEHSIEEDPNDSLYNAKNSQFKKYASSFSKLQDTIAEDTNSRIYGLHFMTSQVNKNNVIQAPTVKINCEANKNSQSKIINNYELPVGTIDFNLAEGGYMNFFAGSYMAIADINTFFSLHQVFRTTEGTGNSAVSKISDIKEIQNIYSDGDSTHSYIVEYKGEQQLFSKPYVLKNGKKYNLSLTGDPSYADSNLYEFGTMTPSQFATYSNLYKYKSVFNTNWITSPTNLTQSYLFYFEIPLNAGEYCMGPVSGRNGGYLLYLDIGANASRIDRTKIIEHMFVTQETMTYPLGVAFVDLVEEKYKPGDGQFINEHNDQGTVTTSRAVTVEEEDSVCVSVTVGYTGDFVVERGSDAVNLIRATSSASYAKPVYKGNDIEHLKINGTDVTDADIGWTKHTYDIVRLNLFDYNASIDDLTITVITDTKIDNGSYTRSVEQILHAGTTAKDVKTDLSDITVYRDDGTTYIYDDSTNTHECMDRTDLSFSSSETSIMVAFYAQQDISAQNSGQEEPIYDLVFSVNAEYSVERHYLIDGYQIVIVPKVSAIEVTIIDVAENKTIYFGTISNNTFTATYTITVNNEGDTITIAVP